MTQKLSTSLDLETSRWDKTTEKDSHFKRPEIELVIPGVSIFGTVCFLFRLVDKSYHLCFLSISFEKRVKQIIVLAEPYLRSNSDTLNANDQSPLDGSDTTASELFPAGGWQI
jgi:hypothetical protein